jgi:hypothetical protein
MMVRTGFYLLQIIVLSLTVSCSDSEDTSEKGSLKETQDKIAQEAVDYIKVPLDKAKEASELANRHTQQVKEAENQ